MVDLCIRILGSLPLLVILVLLSPVVTPLGGGSASAQSFEAPAQIQAQEVLAPMLLVSDVHRVEPTARVEDNLLRFEFISDYGGYEVTSIALLERRVAEAATLARVVEQFERQMAGRSGTRGRDSLFGSGQDLRELSPSSAGASTLSSQLSQNDVILTTRGGGRTKARSTTVVADEADPIYDAHKRNVAFQTGLDPYSTNRRVQQFLRDVASARTHGRFSAGTGLVLPARRATSGQVEGGRIDAEVRSLLKHLDAGELDAGLESELISMGVSEASARAFLINPNFTMSTKASLAAHVDYLGRVDGRAAVFEAASRARSEAEAVSFEQFARMLALYHEKVGKIRQFISGGSSLPGAVRADGALVLMLPVDYVYWTAAAAKTFDSLRAAQGISATRPIELVVRGRLTPRAQRELAARGVTTRVSFLTAL